MVTCIRVIYLTLTTCAIAQLLDRNYVQIISSLFQSANRHLVSIGIAGNNAMIGNGHNNSDVEHISCKDNYKIIVESILCKCIKDISYNHIELVVRMIFSELTLLQENISTKLPEIKYIGYNKDMSPLFYEFISKKRPFISQISSETSVSRNVFNIRI